MRIERRELARSEDADGLVADVRGLAPGAESVAPAVAEIVARVRAQGDAALIEFTRQFDTGGAEPPSLRVDADELAAAVEALDDGLRGALELAIANVAAVARAGLGEDVDVALAQGQRVLLREFAVRRAAVYVPGGRAPYPSTVVMGAVTARAAGVDEVVVVTPPGADGRVAGVVLAACELCGVDELYRVGGAQAIAALAYGTASVPRVDVIVGPGNLYVQEAKRLVSADVGIDGFAGPSDLLVLAAADALADADGAAAGEADSTVRPIVLDLLAQAEHGPETLVLFVSPSAAVTEAVAQGLAQLAPERPTADPAACVVVLAADLDAALAFAEAYAPEHLELVGAEAEALAPRVRAAGCVFVGATGATAFGDYVAGSNHILPTGGAARFASSLSPRHFRRRVAEVHVGDAAAEPLADAGAAIARAEGFEVHAESMEARVARVRENPSR